MAVPAGNRGKAQPGALQDSGAHRRGSPLVVAPKLFTMTSLGSAIVSPQGPNSELRDARRAAVKLSQDILAAASRHCTRSHPPAADGTIIRQAVGLTFDGPADSEGLGTPLSSFFPYLTDVWVFFPIATRSLGTVYRMSGFASMCSRKWAGGWLAGGCWALAAKAASGSPLR